MQAKWYAARGEMDYGTPTPELTPETQTENLQVATTALETPGADTLAYIKPPYVPHCGECGRVGNFDADLCADCSDSLHKDSNPDSLTEAAAVLERGERKAEQQESFEKAWL